MCCYLLLFLEYLALCVYDEHPNVVYAKKKKKSNGSYSFVKTNTDPTSTPTRTSSGKQYARE